MRHLRFRERIMLVTLLPILVFVLGGALLGGRMLWSGLQAVMLQRQAALVQVAAAGVEGNLQDYIRLLDSIAPDLLVHTGDPVEQQRVLSQWSGILRRFSGGVALLDSEGYAVAGTDAAIESLGLNYAFRPFFREVQATESIFFSTVFQDSPGGFDAVVIAMPLNHWGEFAGVLVGEFDLRRAGWAQDLKLLKTPQGGSAYLVDSQGTLIFHPDVSQIGQRLDDDADLDRLVREHSVQSLLYRVPSTGERLSMAYAPVPGTPWGILMEDNWNAVIAPFIPYVVSIALLLFLGLCAGSVALSLGIGQVVRPMTRLIAVSQRVVAGEPFQPLAEQGPPDIRLLLQMINAMMARVASQRQALQQYAQRILESQEAERLRLARELHDQTVQDLIALGQRIELLRDAAIEGGAQTETRLDQLEEMLQGTVREVRRMSSNLRPLMLEDMGLPAALQALCDALDEQLAQAQVHYEVVGTPVRLGPQVELGIYRIAQEALSNVRRHAQTSTRVNVALIYDEGTVVLLVDDDGKGFVWDPMASGVDEGHLGLLGMEERAHLLGGELCVETAPGRGTMVRLELVRRQVLRLPGDAVSSGKAV